MQRNRNIILPNMITLLNLLCGLYAIVVSMDGRYTASASAIILASVFDGLDGKVARLVKGTSEFGVQLDSLADVISFGVAPAILIYNWQLNQFDQIGIMAIFLFTACGALRLARFNVQTKVISNIFFVGIPIPGAAAVVASGVIFVSRVGVAGSHYLPYAALVITCFLGFLMVSTIPYYSFKNLSFLKVRPFETVLILVIFLVLIGLEPRITIFLVLILYILSGFFMIPLRKRILKKLEGDIEA